MAVSKAELLKADRGHMLAALKTIAGKPADQWLPAGHPCQTGELPRKWPAVRQLQKQHVIDALAFSVPNHCIDGWSYAARGLSSLLAGDMHAARHLAYYAQLRATLSILANLGIGIFNRINFVVQANGDIARLDPAPNTTSGLSTHTVVWEALEAWGANTQSAETFLELFRVRSVSLLDCVQAIWPGLPAVGAASKLIDAWGIDLKRSKKDHEFRNVSSYVPQALNPIGGSVEDDIDFVERFWELFEPSAGASFDKLDRHLIRALLQKQHRNVAGNKNLENGPLASRYDQLSPQIQQLVPADFLVSASEPETPLLLTLASARSDPAPPLEMLARAFLLLRTSTAFTHRSFVDAGLRSETADLRPWIDQWASARGFWRPNDPLEDPADLWLDVELALMELESSKQPPPTNLNDWLAHTLKGVPTIFEAERIAVWSLSA